MRIETVESAIHGNLTFTQMGSNTNGSKRWFGKCVICDSLFASEGTGPDKIAKTCSQHRIKRVNYLGGSLESRKARFAALKSTMLNTP